MWSGAVVIEPARAATWTAGGSMSSCWRRWQAHYVRIRYRSLSERQEISTRLSPYRLLFSRRSWYVIGRSSLHRATRTFNLGRIRSIEMLEDRYRVPRGFSIERYLRNAWHLIPEPGPDREVVVRFSPMVAQNVAEVLWHKTQRAEFSTRRHVRFPRDGVRAGRDFLVDPGLRRPGGGHRAAGAAAAGGPAGGPDGGPLRPAHPHGSRPCPRHPDAR